MDGLVLVGDLVQLRTVRESDRHRVLDMRRTDEIAQRWRGDDLEDEFDEDLSDEELHQLAIERDDIVVGVIQFSEEDDPDYRHASIDIYIDPSFHRQGLAADAITTLVNHLFDDRGHHRLVIDPATDNTAAIACYRKVGFQDVGVMRSYERRSDGSWSDGLLLDMLTSDRPPQDASPDRTLE